MPNGRDREWKGQPFQKGDRVRTARKLEARDYSKLGQERRRAGVVGHVVDLSNSHGVCFRVDYDGGGYGWFDSDELEGLGKPTALDRLMGEEEFTL